MREEKKRYIVRSDPDSRVPDVKEGHDTTGEVIDPTDDAILQKLLSAGFQSS